MNEIEILASTYYDDITITRPIPIKNGSFDDFKDEEIWCGKGAISFTSGSTQGESDTFQAIEYIAILYLRPEIDIAPGDKVNAIVQGREYDFLTGEGAVYPSHWEIPLIRSDRA
ncbi:MAG: hypothetical protein GXZ08_02430 [Tissierellia bacterium]|nr:hypothetical protein [Tissierellia bacterium]